MGYKNPDKMLEDIIEKEYLGEIIREHKNEIAYLISRVNQLEIIILKLWKREILGTSNINTIYEIVEKERRGNNGRV